ncbi:IscS subfamily cysteine desulfurase [Echinicola strongylocentroti]|uniref:cysteine desulfurase n=1 Tax=Echinicola strongylocentroti TaxID=1795355 RepID=A0A2Z4IF12_9BACT|nr:cysteine desulfurase family protein [Echinicola strongylocentroti]AWW29681.1 IscS subfamily cysteine desulfurase [Echinicola strongylocentroti]
MYADKKIYLDYNSTTPCDEKVVEAMLPYFSEKFGNSSSSSHSFGWDAEEAVDIARQQIAELINSKQSQLYFTSGATEAVNLALLGTCEAIRSKGSHIITCTTEHSAVLRTCQELEKRGFSVTFLDVDSNGKLDLEAFQKAIRPETILACIMYANNETGLMHPIQKIAQIAHDNNVLVMSDITQAVGKTPLDIEHSGIDLAAFSAHKIYGPKGIGALYIRNRTLTNISPVLFGGGHEKGLRPGTLNIPAIVGFGKACQLCMETMTQESRRSKEWRDRIERELVALGEVRINSASEPRLPHMSSITIDNINGSKLLRQMGNLAISQGSACSSGTLAPSHVLLALGHSKEAALSSIRIGLGRPTTAQEVETTIATIKSTVKRLREVLV